MAMPARVPVPTPPASHALAADRCAACRTRLLVELPGEVMIRNAILRVDAATGTVSAKCPRCKAWVSVPLRYLG